MPDLLKICIDGGWMMVPLVALSIIGFTVVFERGYAFYRNAQVDVRGLRARVFDLLRGERVEEAATLCDSTPHPVSAVLLAGLQAYQRHKPFATSVQDLTSVMEKAMDDYAEHALSAVEKRLYVLSTIGTAAPLLGMLGTVIGMIMTFEELEQSAGTASTAELAGGIAVALITTGAGLFIALCATIPYNWFTTKADEIDLLIDESSTDLLDLVATQIEGARARVVGGGRMVGLGRGGGARPRPMRVKGNGLG